MSTLTIPLSQGRVAVVDAEDYESLAEFKWSAVRRPHTFYAVRHRYLPDGRRRLIRMHTQITGFARVDHADGNGLNNRRANLRDASASENSGNTRSRGGSSLYRGVTWHVGDLKWQASAARRYLGQFDTEEAAALAFDAAARTEWGEFATLNFPRPGERSALTGEIV